MNEYITGLLVIFSEVGIVLALIAIIVVVLMMMRKQKDNALAHQFTKKLQEDETPRRSKLVKVLVKVHEMDEVKAKDAANAMLNCEKQIYSRVLKIFLGKDRDSITKLQKDVEGMASAYRHLIDTAPEAKVIERGENPKQSAAMRVTIKKLGAEKEKLEKDLSEAMESMDGMLKEYTQMYSGGGAKKEGVKHLENEMIQLKQKIAENLVKAVDEEDTDESNEGGGAVPDLQPDSPTPPDPQKPKGP